MAKQTGIEKHANKYITKNPKPGKVGIAGKGAAGLAAVSGYSNARSEGYSRTQSAGVGAATGAPVYGGLIAHKRTVHKAMANVASKAPGTTKVAPKIRGGRIAAGAVGAVVAEHAAMGALNKHRIASNGY